MYCLHHFMVHFLDPSGEPVDRGAGRQSATVNATLEQILGRRSQRGGRPVSHNPTGLQFTSEFSSFILNFPPNKTKSHETTLEGKRKTGNVQTSTGHSFKIEASWFKTKIAITKIKQCLTVTQAADGTDGFQSGCSNHCTLTGFVTHTLDTALPTLYEYAASYCPTLGQVSTWSVM